MAEQGLFGPSPWEIQQAQQQSLGQNAADYARMNAAERSVSGMYQAGGMLGGMGAEALGMKNVAVENAQRNEQELSGIDTQTPESILKIAQQVTDPRVKFQLMQLAQKRQSELAEIAHKNAQSRSENRKAEAETSPLAKINPKDYTQDSMKLFYQGGMKDPSTLVPIADTESSSTDMKLVNAAALANGFKPGTPEHTAFTKKEYQKLLDKKTTVSVRVNTVAPVVNDATMDMMAHTYLTTGTLPSLGMGAGNAALKAKILSRAAELGTAYGKKPEEIAAMVREGKADTASAASTVKDFASGVGARRVAALNTALNHLETVDKLALDLGNSDVRIFNAAAQMFAKATGNPAPTNFDAARQLVAAEVIKAVVANGGGVAERQEAQDQFRTANSPAQLKQVVETYRELLGGQLLSLEQQYTTGSGRKDFTERLSPATKSLLKKVSPAAPPTADKFVTGKQYKDAKGNVATYLGNGQWK